MATNAFAEEISYTKLFPDTTFNNVDDVHSIYGPGAYFVTLMNLVKDHVTPTDNNLSLEKRRPDLWNLDLTSPATHEEQPYLRKAVALMENFLDKNGLNKTNQIANKYGNYRNQCFQSCFFRRFHFQYHNRNNDG